MRVALCLSGLPRAVATAHGSIKSKILEPLNPDIFVYFWRNDAEWRTGPKEGYAESSYYDQIQTAKALYKGYWNVVKWVEAVPTNLVKEFADKYLEKEQRTALHRDKRKNALSMYKAIHEADKLRRVEEQRLGEKYDCVIRARTDISIRGKFEINQIQPKDTIVIPHISGNEYQGGYSDVLAWGPSEAMSYYSDVYPNFGELQKEFWDKRYKDKGCFWNSHLILKKHLDNGPWKVYTFGTDLRKRNR